MNTTTWLLLLSVLSWGSALAQETVFVTDHLVLGLYSDMSAESEPIRLLPSGTALKIVAREGRYAQVVTQQGESGWVKSSYLVKVEPAVLRIKPLQRENRELQQALQKARRDQGSAQAEQELRAQLQQMSGELGQAQQVIDQLQVELQSQQVQAAAAWPSVGGTRTLMWITVVVLVLLVGLAGGYALSERRVRKRLYGFSLV